MPTKYFVGLSDADFWANSEDLNSILENCLRFVIIDKALLACLLVIEVLDLRQACGRLGDRKQFPSPLKGVVSTTNGAPEGATARENTSHPKQHDEMPSVERNMKSSASKKVAFTSPEVGMATTKGSVSPRREKLKNLKHTKTELEKEISEMHEDTTKLETELFSTMEEKTKVEEELFGMKHHVTKLRSELFHLKLERSNLETDVKKSKSQENLQKCADSEEGKLTVESPKEALRGYPELSDVMEASHESNDSENSSQMSDGNETREAFLKTCMENISKIYTLMPNPDEEIASEDELSDDQEPTLSDANIDDSDEEIIITKLARSLRSPCTSPAKEKSSDASSPNKSGKKEAVSNFGQKHQLSTGNDSCEDLGTKSKDALVKQIQELKRKLHKVEQELAEAQETSEDLEEELDHKKGQLAEAQETITNLENQVVEEKETCEQVRQQYFNVKTQNEILEEQIKALRSELERVLVRENNALSGNAKLTENIRKDNPPPSPTKMSTRSPIKSPGKTKAPKIDLRNPPPKQLTSLTSNEMEVVGLIEENAELKVKLGKATQEKTRLEKSQKLVEEKSTKMKAALQASEDACSRFKDELAIFTKEKVRLAEEITELRNNNSSITEELQRYREKSTRLEKDIEAIAYMSTRLEKDNKTLEMEISKMESELSSWRSKHEVTSQECKKLNEERVQVERECEKAVHELETLRKEKNQLMEQTFSNDKENQRRDKELKSKEDRYFEVESELSEEKRLNSNLQKELAGMAEYQEALENEYSKAKSEEDRLKQELAKVNSRVTELETELTLATQNTHDEGVSANHREDNLSFGQDPHLTKNPHKLELHKGGKSFTGTPSKKFYTITHTSEDEIGDTSSSIAESPADDSKVVEHENQLLKLENGYLQQQLTESEHVLAMYRQDLESAHDLIDKLQAEVKVLEVDTKQPVTEEDCKTPTDKDDTIKEIGDCPDNASDEYKLLEEKHAELTREYESLRQQYQEALTDKETVADGVSKETLTLEQHLHTHDKMKKEVSASKKDVPRLHERIRQLEADNAQLKITAEELSHSEKVNNGLLMSLEDAKRVEATLEERIRKLESENDTLRVKLDVTAPHKDSKSVRRRSLGDQITRLNGENEALTVDMLQSSGGGQRNPLQSKQSMKEQNMGNTTGDDEIKMRQLEEDLLKVTSDKLKLEFELRGAKNDCERLRNDLHQSESERNLLNTQLDENIEKAANLEIRLMEMRCSCETIKDEINTLKNQKRQESFHLHEASVCKEILEKRLEDALKENNFLHHELDSMREERKENEQKGAKLEKEKDHLTKEIDEVKIQIRKLEQDFEESKVKTDGELRENEKSEVDVETMTQEGSRLEQLTEYKKLHEEDQEQLMILREEVERLTTNYTQTETELEEIKDVKQSHEKQMENMENKKTENGAQTVTTEEEEMNNSQKQSTSDRERTTFDTLEIEKHTKILEKEKGLLEKELTRVQEECNKLKEKLELINHASDNAQTQEERRKELEGKQEQLEKELQELRELNQKLESECEDSHKLIQQLEIKTKALESLQKELHCFHTENDRLTHEVEIIHHTSKAMTDHQRSKDSLETENSLLKQELESLKDQNKKLQMETEDLSKDLLTFKEQSEFNNSTENRNASLQSEIEKFQKMHQHLEQELESTRDKTKALETANESLKKENKAVKGRIKSLEQRNEELRRKDDKKKAATAESKSKAKTKHGQGTIKESKEVQTVENENDEENYKDLRENVEQLRHEKVRLEEQLNSFKVKVNSECVVVPVTPSVTIATQTTEFQLTDQALGTLENTSSKNHVQETNMEPEGEKESAPLNEDMKTGFSLMAKEKLLLEKKASHFARAQMQLEQSFAKALRENAALKGKVDEAENVLGVLRGRVHELEKKNLASLLVVDLKKSVLMSSDSENDSDEEVPANDDLKEGQKDNKDVDCQTNAEDGQKSTATTEDGYLSSSTQTEVDDLRREKEHLLKELEGLKSQKEDTESDLKRKKEGLGTSVETQGKAQPSTIINHEDRLLSPTQSEVDQLRSEKDQLLKELEGLKSQKIELENYLEEKKENAEAPNETDNPVDKHEQENALLKQERQSLLKELEAATNQRNVTESELRHNKESCLKQEQEIKLLLSSYSQEKESLLNELENTKFDCRKAKEKLRELQQIESEFEDIRKKSKEAEKLITELEKDLLSQTEMKNELRRELQTCKNQLQEIEHLETQLRSCRTENDDLHTTNMQLMDEMKKWKDENDLKDTRLQLQKVEKQRMNRTVNPGMKRLQDQCVQTESPTDYCVNENEDLLEDNMAPTSVQDSYNREENNTDQVKSLPHSSEMGTEFHETNDDGVHDHVEPEATETAQTEHKYEDVEITTTNSKEATFVGVPIPIIIVTHVDDIETIQNEKAASLSLCLEDFENDSPKDQSTPDEEKERIKPPIDRENTKEMQVEPLYNVPEQKDGTRLEISLPQLVEGTEKEPQKLPYQEELATQLGKESEGEKPSLEARNNAHDLHPQYLDGGELKNVALDVGVIQQISEEDESKSRRELEWTISRLKSELFQRSEENEKNQQEIGLLVEEQLSMKREISTLLSECESLRAKAALLQTQNEAVLKEQILNDEENEELQQNLQDLIQERNLIQEAKRNLESQKARLEIELSDAIETREAMERELLRIRSEGTDASKHRLEGQLHDISERHTKLETVLSCVLDENSKMAAELSALQAENSMLKSFKIMEITDNYTQFSPRTTEDESDGEGMQSVRRASSLKTTLPSSNGNSASKRRLSLGDNLTRLPFASSPSSSEPRGKFDSPVTPSQVQDDGGTTTEELPGTPTVACPKNTDFSPEPEENRFDEERKRDRVPVTATNGHSVVTPSTPPGFGNMFAVGCFKDTDSMAHKQHNKQQRKRNSTLHQIYDTAEDAAKQDSDDNDSSMEGHTSSSLVSVTDLDISISSDQISSEDSSIVGSEIRVLQRMQKELAETKCSNVLVKNELSIIRKHNSDLQNQVQKLLSRNNHLKTKMCDRTLSVKRMEKEVSSIKDENNRLQQQAQVLQEEMARVEKEKAKFERNISATKSENKRLKSDLSSIKAESYRTMKELVNLQSENRRLQLEIERLKEEARSFKGTLSDESVSQELSLWGSMPHGDFRSTSRRSLQERPAKPEPVYLQQRAASDLAFSQHQRLTEHPETPVREI